MSRSRFNVKVEAESKRLGLNVAIRAKIIACNKWSVEANEQAHQAVPRCKTNKTK